MLKQIICTIVESRPLEPCRSLSHRQSDNCHRDRYTNPPRPDFREKTPPLRPGIIALDPKKPMGSSKVYPVGVILDILA